MLLSNPGYPLYFVNKVITLVKYAKDIDFPNFPLGITKEKAEDFVSRLASRWWSEDDKEEWVEGLYSK